jgi:hypothetical protein
VPALEGCQDVLAQLLLQRHQLGPGGRGGGREGEVVEQKADELMKGDERWGGVRKKQAC